MLTVFPEPTGPLFGKGGFAPPATSPAMLELFPTKLTQSSRVKAAQAVPLPPRHICNLIGDRSKSLIGKWADRISRSLQPLKFSYFRSLKWLWSLIADNLGSSAQSSCGRLR
jgi:hypothetical protein